MHKRKIIIRIFIMVCCFIAAYHSNAQKYDYNYINRSFPSGSGVSINYNDTVQDINIDIFEWEGTVSYSPVLSDKQGKFLGYFNCRNVYDSIGRVAINGDSMAVGYFLNFFFQFLPEHEGLGNAGNSLFIPINDSLFYLLYKSAELWTGAPDFAVHFEEKGKRLSSYSDGLYLSKIRLNNQNRLYILPDEKHILLVDDLFQFRNLITCKHANGLDWWLIIPKALTSEASRILIRADGVIEILDNIEFSDNYWRTRSMTACKVSPDGNVIARFIVRPDTIFEHLLELFHFNRCEGTTERFLFDSIPLTNRFTSAGDIEFSENGRYLYIANGEIILQMDLEAPNFFSNPDTIARWDGYLYYDILAPIFDCLWRLPNGKILVSSMEATPFLHYITNPNLPGETCMFEQRAIMLPVDPLNEPYGVFITALPNFPPFRMPALTTPCSSSLAEEQSKTLISLYPNPSKDRIIVENAQGLNIIVYNIYGHPLLHVKVPDDENLYDISLENQLPGIYFFSFKDKSDQIITIKKNLKL